MAKPSIGSKRSATSNIKRNFSADKKRSQRINSPASLIVQHPLRRTNQYRSPNSGSTGFSNNDASRVTIVKPEGVTK